MELFAQIKNCLIRANKSKLDVYEKAVLNVLISYGSCDKIYLGQKKLANESGMSRDKVVSVVRSLKKKGYLSTELQPDRSTLIYKLLTKAVVVVGDRVVADSDRGCSHERQGVVADSDTSNTSSSNTSRDILKPRARKKKIDLPDWLDKGAWNEWVEYRKEIKKKLTPSMITKQLKFLERNNGNHVEIINQTIQNGWTGLFDLKNGKIDKTKRKPIFMTDEEKKELEDECPF